MRVVRICEKGIYNKDFLLYDGPIFGSGIKQTAKYTEKISMVPVQG